MLSFLLNLIWPKFCVDCGKLGDYLCIRCFSKITFLSEPPSISVENSMIDQAISMCRYEPPISTLVKTLKYKSVKGIGKYFAELMYYSLNLPSCDFITFVPLHPRRLDERGFNQTQAIAFRLSELIGVECLPLLKRVVHSTSQAKTSSKQQRQINLEGVFKMNQKNLPFLASKTVLLVDDVLTTGATTNECAKLLKRTGATRVVVLTAAFRN